MNLTIKEKMYLLAAAVALVSLTILGVALYGIKSFNDIAHTRDLARETESRMLMLRRHEKDFFARKDLKYQGKFNEQLATLKQRLQELQAMSMTIGTASGDAEQLQTVFSTYGQKFEQVVNVMVRIGLDHKSGLHGDLRRAAHQAESMIRESGSDTLLSANLMLRRHEKDFFQRHDLKYAESFDATHQAFKEALLADGLASDSQRAILSQMETYQSLFHQTVDAYVQLGLDPRSGLHGEMRRAVHESETLLDSTIAHTVTAIEREQRRVEKTITTTALTLSLALIAVIIVLVRNIVRSLQRLLHEMNEIAEGDADLRVRLPDQGRDEMAHMATAFNRFVERIQGVVREVTDVSQNLASAADQTAVSIEHTAQMLNRQHRETEQVATAMNQMSATINEVANNAATAADATHSANSDSQRGKNIVNYSVESIRGLATDVVKASEMIDQLSQRAESIGCILDAINAIADQTNLLALNAAIEAARAGEQGRGFAVVADEVRTLAQRTQESTNEIQIMIEDLRSGTRNATQVMDSGRQSAESVVAQAADAGQALESIANGVDAINDLNTQIASAAEQQAVVSDEINRNIVNINDYAEQTSCSADQIRSASGELAKLTQQLFGLTRQFKV